MGKLKCHRLRTLYTSAFLSSCPDCEITFALRPTCSIFHLAGGREKSCNTDSNMLLIRVTFDSRHDDCDDHHIQRLCTQLLFKFLVLIEDRETENELP